MCVYIHLPSRCNLPEDSFAPPCAFPARRRERAAETPCATRTEGRVRGERVVVRESRKWLCFRVEPDWGIKLLPRCHHNPPYCAGSLLRDLPVLIFILVLPRSTICFFSPLTHPRKTPPRPSGSVLFRTAFFVLSIRGVVANKHAWCLK